MAEQQWQGSSRAAEPAAAAWRSAWEGLLQQCHGTIRHSPHIIPPGARSKGHNGCAVRCGGPHDARHLLCALRKCHSLLVGTEMIIIVKIKEGDSSAHPGGVARPRMQHSLHQQQFLMHMHTRKRGAAKRASVADGACTGPICSDAHTKSTCGGTGLWKLSSRPCCSNAEAAVVRRSPRMARSSAWKDGKATVEAEWWQRQRRRAAAAAAAALWRQAHS